MYLNKKQYLANINPIKYATNRDGILYKKLDDGGSAVFVTGFYPITDAIKETVYFTEPLDKNFKEENDELLMSDHSGNIIIAYDKTINIFHMKQLAEHKYLETIKSDTFLKKDYNLLKSKSKEIRNMAEIITSKETNEYTYTADDKMI